MLQPEQKHPDILHLKSNHRHRRKSLNPVTPSLPPTFFEEGYLLISGFLGEAAVKAARLECERLAHQHKQTCIRNLRSKSKQFHQLALDGKSRLIQNTDYRPVRSILFDKTGKQNWPVAWHQDLTIAVSDQHDIPGYGPWSTKDEVIHVQPPVDLLAHMVTFRIHLDPTPASNGALKVIPGSHRLGRIPSSEVPDLKKNNPVTCECHPGDLLLMSPLILHSSPRSESPGHRRVLHFEFAPDTALHPNLTWHE